MTRLRAYIQSFMEFIGCLGMVIFALALFGIFTYYPLHIIGGLVVLWVVWKIWDRGERLFEQANRKPGEGP